MKFGKERLAIYLILPFLLGGLLLIASIGEYFISREAGTLCLVITVLYYGVAIFLFLYHKSNILRDYTDFALDFDKVQRTILEEMRVPYAILNSEGNVIWSNAKFREISKRSHRGYSFRDLVPDVKAFSLPKSDGDERNYRAVIGEKNFRIYMKMMISPEFSEELAEKEILDSKGKKLDHLIAVFLFDETEIRLLKQENYDNPSKMIKMLIK